MCIYIICNQGKQMPTEKVVGVLCCGVWAA